MSIKNYKVCVNGKNYDVTVEETSGYPESMSTTSSRSISSAQSSVTAPSNNVESSAGSQVVKAPLQGQVLGINVKVGDSVKNGDLLLKIEAMKMENEILSSANGTVASVKVSEGEQVTSGQILVEIR